MSAVLRRVPETRLPRHRLVRAEREGRLRHARGQSLPDWVALRTGRLDAIPDGVAFPNEPGEIRELLAWAVAVGARVIPVRWGTSVVGSSDTAR